MTGMHRLLIVDNELLIVERLLDLFQRNEYLNLEVYGVTSSADALDVMSRTKIDIVLSDIRMPGKNGLELQADIIRQWPRCKVIFLTGYGDFEYAHQAIRNGSVDYLLKTEGEQAIVQTVEKAIRQLTEEMEVDKLIAHAKRQLELTKPYLQKEFLCELLHGDPQSMRRLEAALEELAIPLRYDWPVLAIIGRVDHWREELGASDKELMLFAIQNIAEEYLRISTQIVSIMYDKTKLIWLIQPALENVHPAKEAATLWNRTIRFVHGTLESIQPSCRELLKVTVSFAVANECCDWTKLPEQFDRLMIMLSSGLGLGQESILIDRPDNELPEGYDHEVRTKLRKRDALAVYLDNGQKHQFFVDFGELVSLTIHSSSLRGSLRMEIYYSLVSILLSYINKWGLQRELGERLDVQKLVRYDYHATWNEAVNYLSQLAESLFALKSSGRLHQEDDFVQQVERYVEHNVAGDLSLTRIGEVVGHNPQYLSRLYKQLKNEGLSEYIGNVRLAKAKVLLEQQMKISDVSRAVGFMTEQSFYRFFKKATGLTPQEYRNAREKSITDSGK